MPSRGDTEYVFFFLFRLQKLNRSHNAKGLLVESSKETVLCDSATGIQWLC
jgi:hypothetical protein